MRITPAPINTIPFFIALLVTGMPLAVGPATVLLIEFSLPECPPSRHSPGLRVQTSCGARDRSGEMANTRSSRGASMPQLMRRACPTWYAPPSTPR